MHDSPEPYENVWQYLRDASIGFLLIVGAFLIAGVVTEWIGVFPKVTYSLCAVLATAPFFWFTRYCGLHRQDWWDFVANCFIILAILGVGQLIPHAKHPAGPSWMDAFRILVQATVFVVLLTGWQWIRAILARPRTL